MLEEITSAFPELREILMESLREATTAVEEELRLEDQGWTNLTAAAFDVVPDQQRIINLRRSRLYAARDPLGKQSIRLWTDYTFGPGMKWQAEDEAASKALDSFWNSKANQGVLSARGQRKSSDKLLIDGEVFFAIFLGAGGEATIRLIDPLEILEIITDPDDIENVYFYRRGWTNRLGQQKTAIYRSTTNSKGKSIMGPGGQVISQTQGEDALVYHLALNTITQRGNPLLLPALDWIKQYRRFLASRVAIMLALAKFAWKNKVAGGQTAVDAIKAKTNEQTIRAGSTVVENIGSDTTPIKAESGAKNAYQDARMIKLQVCAAVGIPEQYYGDIESGNLATAKTVELPMQKMFQSYQAIWSDTYQDIDEIVLAHNNVPPEKWYVDRDFPPIAPEDVAMAAEAIVSIIGAMPQFAYSPDVQQMALMVMGINNPAEVLKDLEKMEESGNLDARFAIALREFRKVISGNGKGVRA